MKIEKGTNVIVKVKTNRYQTLVYADGRIKSVTPSGVVYILFNHFGHGGPDMVQTHVSAFETCPNYNRPSYTFARSL